MGSLECPLLSVQILATVEGPDLRDGDRPARVGSVGLRGVEPGIDHGRVSVVQGGASCGTMRSSIFLGEIGRIHAGCSRPGSLGAGLVFARTGKYEEDRPRGPDQAENHGAMEMRTAWAGIRGIVLDAVGTLIEPSPSVADVYLDAARRQGVAFDRETIRSRFVRHLGEDEVDEARVPLATDEAVERRRWRRIVGNVLEGVPDLDRAFEELWEHFGRPESWRCYPDVAPLLEAIRASGLPYRIGSNFDSRLRRIVAGLPELAREASPPLISSEVGYRKPHPEFYRAVCESLALPPEEILSVGDDIENDVRGASRAGLRSVWLDRRGTEASAKEEAPKIPDLRVLVAGWRG